MRTLRYLSIALALVVVLALAGTVPTGTPTSKAQLDGPVQVGTVYAYRAATPRVLPANWATTITSDGAKFVRLHFVDLKLAKGDTLVVSSPSGAEAWTYTDNGPNNNGEFWSFSVDGDTVKVELNNKSGKSRGFRIVEVGHGTVALNENSTEVVCGTDGREAIACQLSDSVVNAAQRPVARLLYTEKRKQYVCTGELIAGSYNDLLITNNHCIDNQTVASTLQARFNYQYTTCTGTTLASYTTYNGGTFLKTSPEVGGLDYTLLTLQGGPEATWGELVATTAAPVVGQQINFIQHPGGNPKKIGYYEDLAKTIRCKVDTINKTYGSSAAGSQIGYGCDSEGGSSGSAITDASTGRIIGLHHYGGVSSSPCLNSASMMSKICTDAGSLLSCVSN